MEDTNIATLQQQPTFPSVSLNITPDGMLISLNLGPGLSVNQALGADIMHHIVSKWLETHPELLHQLAQQVMAAKRTELEVIRRVKKSKVN